MLVKGHENEKKYMLKKKQKGLLLFNEELNFLSIFGSSEIWLSILILALYNEHEIKTTGKHKHTNNIKQKIKTINIQARTNKHKQKKEQKQTHKKSKPI